MAANDLHAFSTIITPISGKLADTFGRKLFFMIGAITFLVGSVLCGLSQSMIQLIIFRAIQGLGCGILMANTFAMIGDIFPPAERAKNSGIAYSAFGLASIIGPLLGEPSPTTSVGDGYSTSIFR